MLTSKEARKATLPMAVGGIVGLCATSFSVAAAEQKAQWQGLEEIVVSAERREATIQEVPISMAALSEDLMRTAKIEDTMDLMAAVPNLVVSNNFQTQIYIRGIGTDLQGIGTDPSVAVHIDGVYVPRPNAALQSFYDVERVEVLRGPQGTLYGRNATGGVLNIITQKPTAEMTARGEVQYGNYDQLQLRGTVSGPLSGENLRARATIMRSRHDSYVNELSTGAKNFDQDVWAGRTSVYYTNTENFEFTVSADFTRDRTTRAGLRPMDPENNIGYLLGGQVSDDFYSVYTDMNGPFKRDQWGITGDMKWTFDGMTLNSLSSFRHTSSMRSVDSDSTDFPIVGEDGSVEQSDAYSQELRLASDTDGPLTWMFGAYYLHEKADARYNILFAIIDANIQLPAENKTDAYAIYTQNSYNILDNLRLTAGLRYSHETKDHWSDVVFNGFSTAPSPGKKSWKAWTPKFGIDYFPTEDVMIYASATRGFKSGGFNSTGTQPSFDPEYIWSYEAGVKSTFADGRVQFNAAGFLYDYKDLQVSVIDAETTTLNIANAASAKIKGAEVGFVALPIAGLRLDANFAFLGTKYKELITVDQLAPGAPVVNLAGNQLPNAPKFTMQAAAEYSHEMGNAGSLSFRGEVVRKSHVYFSQYNYDVEEQNGYNLVNASIRYMTEDERWQVMVYGKNLFDKEYITNAFRMGLLGGATVGFVGVPRTYGVSLAYQY